MYGHYQGGSIWEEFKARMFDRDDSLVKIILFNCIVFFLISLLNVFFVLFSITDQFRYFSNLWLALPPDIIQAIFKPWTFITYQFMHASVMHIAFNMIVLYWSGRIFQDFLGNHRLLPVYILGGIAGGLLYLAAFQIFPYLQEMQPRLGMVGASASVFAILVAIGTYLPNFTVHLIFFGGVRLKYIILILIAIDLISLAGSNAGGHFAHLGGALFGYLYTSQLSYGRDIGLWAGNIIDKIKGVIFGGSAKSTGFKVHKNENFTEKQDRKKKEVSQEEIDRILDKIAQSGYNSLTEAEKEILFKASNRK